jgi:hypothetical protein
MRIIDADAYAVELQKLRESYQILDNTNAVDKERLFKLYIMHGIFRAERALKKQPTVDAVPVVRCRECKHAKDEDFISAIWCENLEKYLAYDFFCHDGERKDTDKGEQ